MSTITKLALILYFVIFATTGVLVTCISMDSIQVSPVLKELQYMFFMWHLACWIVLGMLANYLWDLFNADMKLSDIKIQKLLLPLLVSPIVMYATWHLFLQTGKSMSMQMELLAFQNGFFWQAIFSKAGPATKV